MGAFALRVFVRSETAFTCVSGIFYEKNAEAFDDEIRTQLELVIAALMDEEKKEAK